MVDRLKQIPAKILEWWKKYTTKQKALLGSIAAVVVIALVILAVVLTTPKMVILKECENTKEASQVKSILDENGIKVDVSNDGLVFKVNQKDESTATLLLAENNVTTYGYDWENLDNVFDGGFSATETDKSKKYQLYMEGKLEELLESIGAITNADVRLSVPTNDGTILAQEKESYASVVLELSGELEEGVADGLARTIATAIGNDTTNNIAIMDSSGNMLFYGGETDGSTGTANSNLEVQEKATSQVAEKVRKVVLETNLYDNVSVAPSLDMPFTERDSTDHEVYLGEGLESALPSSESHYSQETTGGAVGGEPGTNANDGGTYVTGDNNTSSSTTTDDSINYANSERITNEKTGIGGWEKETSTLALVATKFRIYNEKTMKDNGELDGTTFEEFRAANEERIKQDVDPELVTLVSNATGIPQENITVVAYEVPYFQYDDSVGVNIMDYLPIVLAALIMLMLGFVVFRSTRKEPAQELEPELSVEALLESTKEAQEDLEDIGFSEKSETRVLIEKFVDENPEAAASLLRNWLNEEWE